MFATQFSSRLMGGVHTFKPSAIELQPGQIFRGMITKVYPNDMVQVQLAGTLLHAELKAPLEVGQYAWLQVLPSKHPITLKVIDLPQGNSRNTRGIRDSVEKSDLEGLLRALGLKVDRSNIHNLQLLMDSRIPLKYEELGSQLNLLRHTATPERTIHLMQVAHQRGLPLQTNVIQSLDAVLFGKSLNVVIDQLSQYAHEHMQARPLIEQAIQLWQQARAELGNLTSSTSQPSINNPTSATNSQFISGYAQPSVTKTIDQNTSFATGSFRNQRIEESHTDSSTKHSPNTIRVEDGNHEKNMQIESSLVKFLRILGVEYESSILSRMTQTTGLPIPSMQTNHMEQLKAVLLELRGLDPLSTHLRETVDTGIRTITGQQLLMLQESNSPWQSFIYQVPLPQFQKDMEPSFIHIEGRRKDREGIDSDNCRLFFHLNLDTLDTMMIDVNIINRSLNIHIYSDVLLVKQWIEAGREEWTQAMQNYEYHMSSIKVSPLPTQLEEQKAPMLTINQVGYQGVDLRI